MEHELLTDIKEFLAAAEMAPSRFGRESINDGHLVRRLEQGCTVTLKTAERVRTFIAEKQKERTQ
jgi:hypothetical protein